MTQQQETSTHCFMCGHPIDSHDLQPDGNRPCRSPGHPKGVPCADCRALLTSEYRAKIQDERETEPFQDAWNAYYVTLQDAREAFGEHAPVCFTDIHQSALASALIAYRKQHEDALKSTLDLVRNLVVPNSCSYDNCGHCGTHGLAVGTNPTCAHARARALLATLETKEPTT